MSNEQGKKMGQLIAKCWADEGFKQKLLADTMATLKAEGAELPAGLTVKALENTDKVFHLVIPAKPTDLSDADLDQVGGGGGGGGDFCDPATWKPGSGMSVDVL
jgi:hypothetical protein